MRRKKCRKTEKTGDTRNWRKTGDVIHIYLFSRKIDDAIPSACFPIPLRKKNGDTDGFFHLEAEHINGNKHPKTPTCPHFFGQITGRPG